MKNAITAIMFMLVAASLDAQSTHLELRRVGNQWVIDYYPSPQQGASMLHFSTNLSGLQSNKASIMDVPASSVFIPLDVTSLVTGERGFFSITEFPGLTAADFAVNNDDPVITEVPPTYNVETLTDMTFPLTTSTPLRVNFRLLDGTAGTPMALNGSVRLELRTASGGPVGFAYTLTPNVLPMGAGIVDGTVTITTAGALTEVYLAVAEVTPSASFSAKTLTAVTATTIGNSNLGNGPKMPSAYLNTATGWHYPMSVLKELNGCFGEWRSGGTYGSGQAHFGMDLSTGPGTDVYPVKRGVVSRIGDLGADGKYIVVVHGDGYASRYLHVDPVAQVHQVVETNTVIARTASIASPHLHLELRSGVTPAATAGAYTTFGAFPGAGFDAGMVNQSFDTPPIQAGVNELNVPQIKGLYVWGKSPKNQDALFAATLQSNPVQLVPGETGQCLVAQIIDKERTSPTSGYLVPAHFDFAVEDPVTRALVVRDAFDYNMDAEVRKLFQDQPSSFVNFGYVRRVGNELPLPAMYQYWFKWDTSGYAIYPNGPRQVRLSASDRAGHSTTQTYAFGPELTNPGGQSVDPSAPNGATFTLTAKSYMGPFPAVQLAQSTAPRDEITFSFQGSTTSWDAFFIDPANGNQEVFTIKRTFIGDSTGVKQDTVQIRVKKKSGAATPTAAVTLTIKAASGVFPNIAHTVNVTISPAPAGMAVIPAGIFQMGNSTDAAEGGTDELPAHTVYVSAFYMDRYEVTKQLWDDVRAWGLTHGYTDLAAGVGKVANHPVQTISWYNMVKWCNARSQMEGLVPMYYTNDAQSTLYQTGSVNVTNAQVKWSAGGYRLPTEAEWEKAARGGSAGHRFPWVNVETITHSQANYYSDATFIYDVSPTRNYHPTYAVGSTPYTNPVGSFAPNGYGLYDMAGNVWEWCWDWYGSSFYSTSPSTDPQGSPPGAYRVYRGGGWSTSAHDSRVANRGYVTPGSVYNYLGFRPVRR